MPKSHVFPFKPAEFQDKLLAWYRKNRRDLPWRALSGVPSNPYHVWLSEIMLQQTTVPAVIPYFIKFTTEWPTIDDLAQADTDKVMSFWAGLGYYARARNLMKCARVVSEQYGGIFPQEESLLLSLPGIGPYTAAAVRSIAFDKPAVVIDGNIERVTARIFAIATPLPEGKKTIKEQAIRLFDGLDHPKAEVARDLPQALMDLGASICSPSSPKCTLCPVSILCQANLMGHPDQYPVRKPKTKVPVRYGRVYYLKNVHGDILLEKRADNRMLGGMMALPTTLWDVKEGLVNDDQSLQHPEDVAQIRTLRKIGRIFHVFSHFRLELDIWEGEIPKKAEHCFDKSRQLSYATPQNLDEIGFPSVFTKVIKFCRSRGE